MLEVGSLNKAAEKLRISQSTLTRQIQALEADIGGALLERTSSGVVATATGQALSESLTPLVERFDVALANIRNFARGQRDVLKVGYVASAAAQYLNQALAMLRRSHPEIKVQLLDLSPGEQIAMLRRSEIDMALLVCAGTLFSREFYTRKLTTVRTVVGMSACDRLADKSVLRSEDLKGRLLIGAYEVDMPGYNGWITQLCRKAGFKPNFALEADSLSHALSSVVIEDGLTLQPEYLRHTEVPGVVFRDFDDSLAEWEISVAWQRGKMATPVKSLLEAFFARL